MSTRLPASMLLGTLGISSILLMAPPVISAPDAPALPEKLRSYFAPSPELAGDLGTYRSPLRFEDGRPVRAPEEWKQRRAEIRRVWDERLGAWPPVIQRPKVEVLDEARREDFRQRKVRVEVAPGRNSDGYLLLPDGKGPFPAVVVVYYDPETGAGLGQNKALRDFGYQLVKRGFVALSMGSPYTANYPSEDAPVLQPLSFLGYTAANCYQALAGMPEVDPARVGVVGHSYGGKWAMFASCLFDKFACAAWSDGGIVFDESRPNVNYWEPWYLGFERGVMRQRGVPSTENPRTGPYRRLMEERRDLHELHALMAPRPFLVSGGSEDPPERWKALNHTVAVNRLLGYRDRVAMTNRPTHDPTPESNEAIYLFFEHFLRARRP